MVYTADLSPAAFTGLRVRLPPSVLMGLYHNWLMNYSYKVDYLGSTPNNPITWCL